MAGGVAGAIIGKMFSGSRDIPLDLSIDNSDFFQQIVLEMMGSFFLVFMYLSSTDPKTKFTKDAAIQTIILSGSYLGSMLLAGTKLKILHASPVNPAIAFGVFLLHAFNTSNMKTLLIFLTAPMGGSFLALIFFRYVYKTTTETLEQEEEDEHNENGLMDKDGLGDNLLSN